MNGDATEQKIDEGLYSRQLYVLGHDGMQRMASSSVLISGLGGLGAEIAKNVILGGVKSVTLHDEVVCQASDLASQFYLTEDDIGKNRAEACRSRLAELNSYVETKISTSTLTDGLIRQHEVAVLTNSTLTEQIHLNNIARSNKIAFIVADTKGLFAQVFCDFGDSFTITDTNGENPATAMVASISKEYEGVVTCLDEEMHGLQDGDYVTFSQIKGMIELNGCEPKRVKVLGPYTFSIGDTSTYRDYIGGGIVTQVKMPKTVRFLPLSSTIKYPQFVITDYSKVDHSPQLHLAFRTLHAYVENTGRLPKPWNEDDASDFIALAEKVNKANVHKVKKLNTKLLDIYAKISNGNVCPMNAVIGGIVAQEVMKAITGKFHPIFQLLYFDALECLPEDLGELKEDNCKPVGNRYDSQTVIFGPRFQQRLGSLKYFTVGAGAIGCELLKNFALMGVGSESGYVLVTDMDLIEKSNLNRQFLFRPWDIGQPKSATAVKAVKKINPHMNVFAHTNQIGPETDSCYDEEFFEDIHGVVSALDNVQARLYLDRKCVYSLKPLVDSGTLGTKGHTQVIIPYQTESYASSIDQQEKGIPICTVKHFPNSIEHTLPWARDLFEGEFKQVPQRAVGYVTDPHFVQKIRSDPGVQPMQILEEIKKALTDERPKTFKDCVVWARKEWEEQFNNQIIQLLHNFPSSHITSTGQPFWSGPKKCPRPLMFSLDNPLHLDFIVAASMLKADVYGITSVADRRKIAEMVKNVSVPKFSPRSGVKISIIDADPEVLPNDYEMDDGRFEELVKQLPPSKSLYGFRIKPLEFEKDDDSNFHMDFIVAASNLRAANYDIPPADKHKSKLIVGRIIPAIATTTSVVAGLVSLEVYKLAQGFKTAKRFKNGCINLALPFYAFSEPMPPQYKKYYDVAWTLWDRFEVQGEMTLRQFLDYFKKNHNLIITMLNYDVSILYSSYTPEDKLQDRMDCNFSQIITKILKRKVEPYVKSFVFDILCTDKHGNDIDVPYVRYTLPE